MQRMRVLSGVLVIAVLVSACAGPPGSSVSRSRPGAELRRLNALAKDAWRTSFEATYSYTGRVPQLYASNDLSASSTVRPQSERFMIAQQGSKSLLEFAGIAALDEGGEQAFVCQRHECLADSPMPRVETPSFFYELRGLATGNIFWADTQGYPITTADLASRGVALAFSNETYADRSATCVVMTYRRDADGQPLTPSQYRTQRWCVDRSGVVDDWSSGRSSLVLTSYAAHPSATAFEPPVGDKIGFPK
jgi:hypothetical protein